MENNEKLKNSKELIAYLCELFPSCFIVEGEARPLKIGIFQDLAERLANDEKVSKTLLRSALRQYTSSWRYLHGVKAGAIRVDLDGHDAGVLTEEHVAHAKQSLKESKDKVFAQRRRPEDDKPRAAKNAADKNAKPRRPAKPKADAAPQPAKPEVVLVKADPALLALGQAVKVIVGKSPVPATVREVAKDDIQVQLATGMVVRVKADRIVL
jgi:ProP effector